MNSSPYIRCVLSLILYTSISTVCTTSALTPQPLKDLPVQQSQRWNTAGVLPYCFIDNTVHILLGKEAGAKHNKVSTEYIWSEFAAPAQRITYNQLYDATRALGTLTHNLYSQEYALNREGFMLKHTNKKYTVFLVHVDYIPAHQFTKALPIKRSQKERYAWIPLHTLVSQLNNHTAPTPYYFVGANDVGKHVSLHIKKELATILKQKRAHQVLEILQKQEQEFPAKQIRSLALVHSYEHWDKAGFLLLSMHNDIPHCLLHNNKGTWSPLYAKRNRYDQTILDTALRSLTQPLAALYKRSALMRTRGNAVTHLRTPYTLFVVNAEYHALSDKKNYCWVPLEVLSAQADKTSNPYETFYTDLNSEKQRIRIKLNSLFVDILQHLNQSKILNYES